VDASGPRGSAAAPTEDRRREEAHRFALRTALEGLATGMVQRNHAFPGSEFEDAVVSWQLCSAHNDETAVGRDLEA